MTESFESTSFSPVDDAPLPVFPEELTPRTTPGVAPEPSASEPSSGDLEAPVPTDDVDGADAASEQVDVPVDDKDELAELRSAIEHLTGEVARHHDRATKREEIIDHLHAESERLRVGERRSTIRPLLLAISRVRDDLLRQSRTLPDDFDAARAEKLLRSFATAVEITLDDYGVGTFAPAAGEAFDPRRHRAIASRPAPEAALAKTIADVRRDGYEDIEAGVTLSQAEVTVYTDPVPETNETAAQPDRPSPTDPTPNEPAPSVD